MKVFLFAVLTLAGMEPQSIKSEVPSLEVCQQHALAMLTDADLLKEVEARGGFIQASCVVQYPPGTKS